MWMDEAACLKTGLIFGHLLIPNSGFKEYYSKKLFPSFIKHTHFL